MIPFEISLDQTQKQVQPALSSSGRHYKMLDRVDAGTLEAATNTYRFKITLRNNKPVLAIASRLVTNNASAEITQTSAGYVKVEVRPSDSDVPAYRRIASTLTNNGFKFKTATRPSVAGKGPETEFIIEEFNRPSIPAKALTL
jgi:hypothetical protein